MTCQIKICGITRYEDALCAVESGVDYLGFIFAPESPRFVTPEFVRETIEALELGSTRCVGVFVNEAPSRIQELMQLCGLHVAQLHGEETPEDVCVIGQQRVWKAFHLSGETVMQAAVASPADAVLVDSRTATQRGGTGKVANWPLAAELAAKRKTVLAGGLKNANVRDAVHAVNPFAVDISSGVEDRPGCKNHKLVRDIIRKIRQA
jgi:phosphoribosylanthranilate isomerase